jgi:hypothetical protein
MAPRCSVGSQVLQRSPTPLERACPPCGFAPSQTGLDPGQIETFQRSPGSRACCFSVCAGSLTTQGRLATRVSRSQPCCLPLNGGQGRHPEGNFRSSIAPPTDALVYASRLASRRHRQDSGSGWSRFLLSCRALSSPATGRFSPAHPPTSWRAPQKGHFRAAKGWSIQSLPQQGQSCHSGSVSNLSLVAAVSVL